MRAENILYTPPKCTAWQTEPFSNLHRDSVEALEALVQGTIFFSKPSVSMEALEKKIKMSEIKLGHLLKH